MSSNIYRNSTRMMAIQRATDIKTEAISRLAWQANRDTQRLRAMRKVFDLYDDNDTDTDSDVQDELQARKTVSFAETSSVVYTAGEVEEMGFEVIVDNASGATDDFDSDSESEVGTLELDEWDEDFDFSSDDDDIMTGSEMDSVADEVDEWDCIDDFPVQRLSFASKREVHSYAEALKGATRGREKGS